MKNLLISFMLLVANAAQAQNNLPIVYLPENITVHFISPEPIQYVDISSKHIAGDLPLKNILRIKYRDSAATGSDAVITITGEKFIAQYHVICGGTNVPTAIDINPADTRPLDIADVSLSVNQLKNLCLDIAAQKPDKRMEKSKAFGIKATLNHVYTLGDYVFLDIAYRNKTNLKYDIDRLRFMIDDKKINKASNVQSVPIDPVYTLFNVSFFKKQYRNIFVFKKLTYPGNKVLHIELSEKQISGRVIALTIPYRDMLEADQLTLAK
jgi:conjugative transposon TraN protein